MTRASRRAARAAARVADGDGFVQAPHAPEQTWTRRFLGRFHYASTFWVDFHRWAIRSLPEWFLAPIILVFTAGFFVALRRVRDGLTQNLAVVLGPCGWWQRQRRLWKTLHNFAWIQSERFERLSTDREFEVEPEGLEHWRAVATDRDYGFLLVTAHVGSWDVASVMPSMVENRHVHIVREQEMDPALQQRIEAMYRDQSGGHFTTHFSRDNPALGTTLLSALRRGDVVGLQGDRPATGGRTIEARLFGHPLTIPEGPAALARAAEAPLLPVFCLRQGRRHYRLVFRPPIRPQRTDDRQADHAAIIHAMIADIEWAIRQQPDQWFCYRPLWPHLRGRTN